MLRYISLTAAALISIAAGAQELTKEILIDREVNPTLSTVSRLNNVPSVIAPQIPKVKLSFSDMITTANVPGMITTLEPATGTPAFTLSPYRGYASLGYFPTYNLAVSAGYAIIAKPKTSLNVWTQFDGSSYDDQYDECLNRNTVTVGADFSHLFGRAKRLDISADFSYDNLNRPWEQYDPSYSTTAFDLDGVWSARAKGIAYFVNAGFSHFGQSGDELLILGPAPIEAVSQNIISVGSGAGAHFTDVSSVFGRLSFDFVHYNHFNRLFSQAPTADKDYVPYIESGEGKTLGLITFAPGYRYSTANFSANIGLKAQITTNADKKFHIAPDIRFKYNPSETFSATLDFNGGQHINRLSTLHTINPYTSVAQAEYCSSIPFAADLKLTFGPFHGASIELFGGYAAANDWLMPNVMTDSEFNTNGLVASYFTPTDLRAFHYGMRLAWKYNDRIEASVKYSGAPGSERHSYYLNPDRAKHILDIAAKVKPIDRLTVEASYQLRAGRSIYPTHAQELVDGDNKCNLHNMSTLNLGADYEVSDQLNVFLRFENLLCRQALMVNLHEQQSLHGLFGVAYKF